VVQTFEASDGAEASTCSAARSPIWCDRSAHAGADGFQLCHGVRELPEGRSTPLLVVSGIYKDAAVVKRVKDSFDAELLTKPIQMRRLVAMAWS